MKNKIVFSSVGLLAGLVVGVPFFILVSISDGQISDLVNLLGVISLWVLPILGIILGYIYGGRKSK